MAIATEELNQMQTGYKLAVEEWIAAIRHEEDMASGLHDEAEIDQWGVAACAEEAARCKAKEAKQAYESALRQEFFNF